MAVTLPVENPADVPAHSPVPTERISVPFEGEGSGTAPLTWGQTEIWRTMSRKGWLNLGGTLPLGPGSTVEDAAEELRFMVSRFPSMRTRFAFDDDGVPSQVLSASGETVLEVYDAEGHDGAEEMAAAVDLNYRISTRDLESQWPVRMGVVRRDGVPAYIVVRTCHMATDGAGTNIIARDMAARDTPPPPGTEQLDLARWQRSDVGRRRSTASMQYWEKTLQSVEPRPFPMSDDQRDPRHWAGVLSSPALHLAARAIGARTGASPTTVVLALYAIALGRRGVLSPAVIRPQANNRFRRGLTSMVSNVVQAGLCVIETADSTVDEVVARAKREGMAAYKNSYHDPDEVAALIERDATLREPGATRWDDYCWAFLNDRRADSPEAEGDGEPVTAEALELALPRTRFEWELKKDNPFEPLYMHVLGSTDTVFLLISGDTERLGPDTIEGLARDIEAIAVAAALDPDAR